MYGVEDTADRGAVKDMCFGGRVTGGDSGVVWLGPSGGGTERAGADCSELGSQFERPQYLEIIV